MKTMTEVLLFLKDNHLTLATAESCTAGQILSLLGRLKGCGKCVTMGFIVYSAEAKKDFLNVEQKTIEKYTLTSEEVAKEMAQGALDKSLANLVIATTGITGDKSMDGVKAGTICFAWGFTIDKKNYFFTKTKVFEGSRSKVQKAAAKFALLKIKFFYEKINCGD